MAINLSRVACGPRTVKQPAVYILASKRNGTLYIGVTSDLVQRIGRHRDDAAQAFTQRYGVHQLVYFELHEEMYEAIVREKQLKKWNRRWKLRLIEKDNPNWTDLSEQIGSSVPKCRALDPRLRGDDV